MALAETLDAAHFQTDAAKAFGSLALCLGLATAGCAWQAHMHAICPLWQKLLCWLAVGTGYFGAFQSAADCARFCFLPQVHALAAFAAVVVAALILFLLLHVLAHAVRTECCPHSCARATPYQAPALQDFIGALLMAPALTPFEGWRLQHFNHLL